MEDLIIKPEETELIAALNTIGSDIEIPMPFEHDIFLFGTEIAGTNYRENIAELYDALQEGSLVSLIREPVNPYDEYAIRVETADKQPIGYIPSNDLPKEYEPNKLGYVPRIYNKVFARLMDAGKYLYGVVRHKEMINGYHRIVIKVYMKD